MGQSFRQRSTAGGLEMGAHAPSHPTTHRAHTATELRGLANTEPTAPTEPRVLGRTEDERRDGGHAGGR